MKNYAQIENTLVINIILVDESNIPDWVVAPTYIQSDTAQIGDTYVDGQFIPYVQPPQTAEQNKQTAITLLQQTDWTSVADVGNVTLTGTASSGNRAIVMYGNVLSGDRKSVV